MLIIPNLQPWNLMNTRYIAPGIMVSKEIMYNQHGNQGVWNRIFRLYQTKQRLP